MCVCSDRGATLQRFRRRLLEILVTQCPAKSNAQDLLRNGELFVALLGSLAGGSDIMPSAGRPILNDAQEFGVVLHIRFMWLSPSRAV